MSIPADLDPSSSGVGFGGNIKLQCINGTFPECRSILVRHLNEEVSRNHITQEQADSKLKEADQLWEKYLKDPAIRAKQEERWLHKNDHEEAICQACSNQIAELRGVPPDSLIAVVIDAKGEEIQSNDFEPSKEEKEEKKPRGRPKKNK